MAENTIANRTLFIADNLDVLRGMNSATVDLIYLDPPFNSGRAYRAPVGSIAAGAAFKDAWTLDDVKEEWVDEIEERNPALHYAIRAAGFSSGPAMQGYLTYMAVRLIEMRRVLKPDGSVYLHCDDTAGHHLRNLMDSVFGAPNFRNVITWKRTSAHTASRRFGRVVDTILFYGGRDINADAVRSSIDEGYERRFYRHEDERGVYRADNPTAAGAAGGESGQPWRGVDPTRLQRHWAVPVDGEYAEWIDENIIPGYLDIEGVMARLDALDAAGLIAWPQKSGGVPQLKRYLASSAGQVPTAIWSDIKPVHAWSKERTGYPTQKPLALLERIVKASSNEGDVVLDPFCGCATTCVAAEKLGREWIGIDLSEKAYDLVVERLAKEVQVSSDDLQGAKRPFSGFVGNVTRRMDAPKRTDLPPAPAGARRSPNVRAALYAAQDGKCNGCEWRMPVHALTIDHIHPRSEEGPDIDANLQLLCSSCNSVKNARIMTLEQLREATKARGTHVSLSEGG